MVIRPPDIAKQTVLLFGSFEEEPGEDLHDHSLCMWAACVDPRAPLAGAEVSKQLLESLPQPQMVGRVLQGGDEERDSVREAVEPHLAPDGRHGQLDSEAGTAGEGATKQVVIPVGGGTCNACLRNKSCFKN